MRSVLIVEKDAAVMSSVSEALAARGFIVEQTSDGKSAPELIRSQQPACVVLAVDLDAGQNGYLICKKLKSDDELKTVPVVIIGDPKGFAAHQKLKFRAEDYLGKPLEAEELVERVGALVGFPELPQAEEPQGEETFDLNNIVEEESGGAEEVLVEQPHEETMGSGDPDFDMVDAMFDDKPAQEEQVVEEELQVPDEPVSDQIDISTGTSDMGFEAAEALEDEGDKTVVGFQNPLAGRSAAKPSAPPPQPQPAAPASSSSPSRFGDPEGLRAKVTELTSALEEANGRANDYEARVRELEGELERKQTEVETAKASAAGGRSESKELFALKEQVNKKDKEILRLKNEVNQKEQELVDLRDRENELERKLSEAGEESAKKDAQLKTLQTKVDQLGTERKRVDAQLNQSREEARGANAKLSTLQADFDAQGARMSELESEAEQARSSKAGVEAELEAARAEATEQINALNEEIAQLRLRVGGLEAELQASEGKSSRVSERLRAQQDLLARQKQTLQGALAMLEESPSASGDVDVDFEEMGA